MMCLGRKFNLVRAHLIIRSLHVLTGPELIEPVEKFWKFKCTKVLQLMNLHYKRRARLLAFGFQHYKSQSLKAKVAIYEA